MLDMRPRNATKLPADIAVLAFLIGLLVGECGFSAQPVEPLVAGAQRYFSLEWQTGHRGTQRRVQGYIRNDWGFTAANVKLLVEGLEPPGKPLTQTIIALGGDLTPGSRAYFETPMPPAPTYRVRVFAFDWLQSAEMNQR